MKTILNPEMYFMKAALKQAVRARGMNEVPVGAVVVKDNRIISRGWNSMIRNHDATLHAEVDALRKAGKKEKNYRLTGTEVYVTLEPCLLCYSAMVQARIHRLVYGADDPKGGIFSTGKFEKVKDIYNHRIEVKSGVMKSEAGMILREFFRIRRGAGAVERDGLENRCRG